MYTKIRKLFIFFIKLLVLVALLLNFWGHITHAYAAVFVVNSNQDLPDQNPGDGRCIASNGTCTLRAAIDETNALVGPNTITIPAMTININSELRIINHVEDDSLSIQGAGAGFTIIDGNNVTRVFMFEACSGRHSISDLTIQNGNNQNTSEPAWNGGAIFNEAELTLTNVVIKNSYAWQGGGIYNQYAFNGNVPVLSLTSVFIAGNQAGKVAGGLFNGSVLDGSDVTIKNNHSGWIAGGFYNNTYQAAQLRDFVIKDNDALEAGGLDNDLGELTLIDGVIDNNVANCCHPVNNAATGGGGVYNNQGALYLTRVSITNNRAPSPGGYGGGIYSAEYLTLNSVAITGNQADYGAGLMNGNYNGWSNNLQMTNVTISNNYSRAGSGGGIFNINNGHVMIKNTTITQNHADIAAGIDTMSTNTLIRIQNSILSGNDDEWGAEDCRGAITSLGNNIVGNPIGNPAIKHPCNYDSSSGDILYVIPNLGPLTGEPAYHPLLDGSPGIDQGQNDGCPLIDIRDMPRPIGLYCDIGSYEYHIDHILYLPFLISQ